jgi:hypothetical protein
MNEHYVEYGGVRYGITETQSKALDNMARPVAMKWVEDFVKLKKISGSATVTIIPDAIKPNQVPEPEPEYTGGSSSYYLVHITNPTTKGTAPYTAECNDIIEALGMNYAEGNVFKAIWRRRAAELGKLKKGYDNGLYDAEKIEFFGHRLVVQSQAKTESK